MSTQEITLKYGAIELKNVANRNLLMAFLIALGIIIVLLAMYSLSITLGEGGGKKSAPVTKTKLSTIAPPPEAENVPPPPPPPALPPTVSSSGAGGGVLSRAGAPQAVPDALVDPKFNDDFNTKTLSGATSIQGDGTGFKNPDDAGKDLGGPIDIGNKPVEIDNTKEDAIPDPDKFVAVEKDPEPDLEALYKHLKYPEIARKNGVEGTVTVRVYVDKNGKPIRNQIDQSDSKMLEEAAVNAVMHTVFTPAIQNGSPIGVWVAVPVKFKLQKD